MDRRYLSKKLAEWYQENRRNLPWRRSNDPYKIWISEVILQQTRVDQGLGYYKNFVKTFPNVHALARAREEKVLRLWQGLGYYTRARNLHRCAKVISTKYNGHFPTDPFELKQLPGVGDYTAAAIASIAFGKRSAVVDGNVYRVLSRIYGIETPIDSTLGRQEFKQLANDLIPSKKPGIYNQAIMEFGALYCTPKNPDCPNCMFRKICVASAEEKQLFLPIKKKIIKVTNRYFNYFVIDHEGSFLMRKREDKDIWKGLYEFFLVETKGPASPKALVSKDKFLKSLKFDRETLSVTKPYKHVLSHRVINCQFTRLSLKIPISLNGHKMKFYGVKSLDKLPKPVLIGNYLRDAGIL